MDLTPQRWAEACWLQEQSEIDAKAILATPHPPGIQWLREDQGPGEPPPVRLEVVTAVLLFGMVVGCLVMLPFQWGAHKAGYDRGFQEGYEKGRSEAHKNAKIASLN